MEIEPTLTAIEIEKIRTTPPISQPLIIIFDASLFFIALMFYYVDVQ
jgi:hypothetical protein